MINCYMNYWGIQGAPPVCAPQQDLFLSFSHTFLPKSVRVGGRRPPNGKSWIRHCEYRITNVINRGFIIDFFHSSDGVFVLLIDEKTCKFFSFQ